jgi:hypothetical protein
MQKAIALLPWYIIVWAVLTLVAEGFFLPTIIRYNYQGFIGPPGSHQGFGGDTFIGAVIGAIWTPILLAIITPIIWLAGTILSYIFRK